MRANSSLSIFNGKVRSLLLTDTTFFKEEKFFSLHLVNVSKNPREGLSEQRSCMKFVQSSRPLAFAFNKSSTNSGGAYKPDEKLIKALPSHGFENSSSTTWMTFSTAAISFFAADGSKSLCLYLSGVTEICSFSSLL